MGRRRYGDGGSTGKRGGVRVVGQRCWGEEEGERRRG